MVYHFLAPISFRKPSVLKQGGGNLVSPQQISRQSFQNQSTKLHRPALGPLLCGSRASLTQRDAWLDWTEGPTPKTPKKYKKREQKRKLYQRFIWFLGLLLFFCDNLTKTVERSYWKQPTRKSRTTLQNTPCILSGFNKGKYDEKKTPPKIHSPDGSPAVPKGCWMDWKGQ